MERTAFLARVADQLRGATGPPLPASFPPTPASGADASPERFLRALRAVDGDGLDVRRSELEDAIAHAAERIAADGAPGGRTAVVSADAEPFDAEIDAALARSGFDVLRPDTGEAWRREAERAYMGVTSAVLAVAATGSVLIGGGADSPRAASILPQHHLVILPVDRLLPGLEEALEEVAAMASTHSSPFLVTGPSRTSDIEMQMVVGAHGPRSVQVVLVR